MTTTQTTRVTRATECDHVRDDATIKALATAGNWKGIIDYCSTGTGNFGYKWMWNQAMTAHYGPLVHESRLLPDGTPDPAKCADVPGVFARMAEAREKILACLDMV